MEQKKNDLTDLALVVSQEEISPGIFHLELQTPLAAKVQPGQFVEVLCPGYFLRRPISVCQVLAPDRLVLVYRVVGDGTRVLSGLQAGDAVDILGPLGHGFPLLEEPVVLVGGGVGIPPLLETAARYVEQCRSVYGCTRDNQSANDINIGKGAKEEDGKNSVPAKDGYPVMVVLGFQDKDHLFLLEDFEALGIHPIVATMDGSYGVKGTVMDAIKELQRATVSTNQKDFPVCAGHSGDDRGIAGAGVRSQLSDLPVLACGPKGMLKALTDYFHRGYLSLEERMGCGLGACMGCIVMTPSGESLRVCHDGPVFEIGTVKL